VKRSRTGTRAVSIDIDADSIRATLRDLEAVPVKVRSKVAKKSLRTWGKLVAKSVKRNISWNAKKTKRNVHVKIATYPRAASNARVKRIWLGIGVKRLPGTIREDVGARAHFYEAGWSPWPKGVKPRTPLDPKPKRRGNYRGQPAARMRAILAFVRRQNKWRDNLKRVRGVRVYATRFLARAGAANVARLPEILADGAREAIMEVSRGKN
jgi:hypothetical protein